MSIAARFGEHAGPTARARPCLRTCLVRVAALCLLLALAGWVQTAHAGLYRCKDAHGRAVYTSHPNEYTHCKAIHLQTQGSISNARGANVSKHGGAVVLRGAVYRVKRADGTVEYTNVAPGHRRGTKVKRLFTYINVCAACAVNSPIDWKTVPLHITDYDKAIRSAAKTWGVQPAFLRAIIHAESAFNPDAVSGKGAQGLMQLMPATASSMGVADAFNPADNIEGGARYLARLLKEFHGNRTLAAAAYNAGPKAVHKYGGVPPFAQTKVYVKRVGTLYQRYHKALAKSAN